MNEIVFYIIVALVVFIGIAFTSYLLPLLRDKLDSAGFAFIVDWVDKAVRFAEQTLGEKQGEAKKRLVVMIIDAIIEQYHINLTEEQINTLIEASVFAMNNEKGQKSNGNK